MKGWNAISDEMQAALHAEQEQLEMHSLDLGIARYRDQRSRSARSNGTPEQLLIAQCLDQMIPAVTKLQAHVAAGKPAKGVTFWGYPLLSLPADKLAFLTLAEIINHVDSGDESSTVNIATAIGARAKIEREFALIRQEAPDVYDYLRRHNKTWNKRAHRAAKTKAKTVDTQWTMQMRVWLGTTLLELCVEHTNILTVERFTYKGKTRVRVGLHPEVRAVIEKAHGDCELLRPFHLPMVVPPCDWGDQKNGGYQFHRVQLVKPSVAVAESEIRSESDMPLVREAVNILQRTEWRINNRILPILRTLWESGGGWAGLPSAAPLPIPAPSFDWESSSETQRSEWKMAASRLHDENARLGSQRKAILHKLWIANKFKDKEVIYFPYQLDWRGRCYPLSSHLHPQADDVGRSLLEFASGKSLGQSGLDWMKIHLANCYGIDKVPFRERVAWTNANMRNIVRSVENPFDYRWWAEAEEAWQTLAACYELANADVNSVSRLPVQVDGSCNGLQHFSAMGRDIVGATAVNLVPSDKPNDVYQQVANKVNQLIEEDLCNGPKELPSFPKNGGTTFDISNSSQKRDGWSIEGCRSNKDLETSDNLNSNDGVHECSDQTGKITAGGTKATQPTLPPLNDTSTGLRDVALALQGKVTRAVVKRATMTIVYGLTRQGMKTQFIEDGHLDSLDGNQNRSAEYLRDKTWQALEGVLVGAAAIMDWLRTVADMAAKEGEAICWNTPAGFLVVQEYVEQKTRHLYTSMQKLTIREPKKDGSISPSRQVRGLPPNFVHSFDASHMMLTVTAAWDKGLDSFAMIHDSYGTHACDVDTLNLTLREEFVRMYETPILAKLHKIWCLTTHLELPPPPPVGDLDLAVVMDSPYFFA